MLSRLVSSLWSQRKTDPKSEMSRCFPHIGASAQRQHVDFSVILTIFCLCVSVSVWFEWHWVFSCDNCTYWWKHVILACWMKHVINQRRFAWDCRVVKGFSDFDPWPPLTLPVRSTLMWFGTQQQLAQLTVTVYWPVLAIEDNHRPQYSAIHRFTHYCRTCRRLDRALIFLGLALYLPNPKRLCVFVFMMLYVY